MKLYHGTTLDAILKIAKEKKLIPQGSKGIDSLNLTGNPDYDPSNYLGYLFFTDELWRAVDYSSVAMSNIGDYRTNEILIVLEVDIPEDKILPDFCDSINTSCWKESLKSVNQVSVKGDLVLPDDSKILFVHYDNPEVVIKETKIKHLHIALKELNIST